MSQRRRSEGENGGHPRTSDQQEDHSFILHSIFSFIYPIIHNMHAWAIWVFESAASLFCSLMIANDDSRMLDLLRGCLGLSIRCDEIGEEHTRPTENIE